MKKILVALLSLGLVMAFSMSAFAVSADFTGQYYVRQNYYSNPSLLDQNQGAGRAAWADTDQRLRLFMRLKIVDGVTLTTRTDIIESVWGKDQAMMPPGSLPATPSAKQMRDYNTGNASFEQLYLTFATGIGEFRVGYMSGAPYQWGTWFLNNSGTAPAIVWRNTFGAITYQLDMAKTSKGDMSSAAASGSLVTANLGYMDRDRDYYDFSMAYKGKGFEAGLMTSYFRWANSRTNSKTLGTGSLTSAVVLDPYFKAKFGPVDLEGEAYYMGGKIQQENGGCTLTACYNDQSIKAKGIFLGAKYNMGPAWVGGDFIYTSGADPLATAANGQDITGGALGTFGYATDNFSDIWSDYVPVILFGSSSDTIHSYAPLKGNYAADPLGQTYDNLWLYNIKGGMEVTKKISFNGKLSFAKLDKVTAGISDSLGTELDLKGTYKIYDCLSYNVGLAYLWTGDFYRAGAASSVASANVANTYFVSHWLNLRF